MSDETAVSWWARHAAPLGTTLRILLGVVWLIDGVLKFTGGFVDSFPSAVQGAAANSPGWLSGWFSFWETQASGHSAVIVYTVGTLELALGLALLFGFARRLAYIGGVFLSLLIWAVPEGFGGPYSSGAGGTDVGTGVIYAIAFLGLIIINATSGPSRLSLDYYLERRFPAWRVVAEFSQPLTVHPPSGPPAT
ncbi:MAG TPA: DoxX family membrane protein [Thermoplasmata archaeon]|nr:DoxX family membrane protein [Thermoplasmata archaeon]